MSNPTPTSTLSPTVDAYRIHATGQVVCAACAVDSTVAFESFASQATYTRRSRATFRCIGCEAQS